MLSLRKAAALVIFLLASGQIVANENLLGKSVPKPGAGPSTETISALTDGDKTSAPHPIQGDAEFLFEFDHVVSPTRLVIHLPQDSGTHPTKDKAAAEVEILASIASADTGFKVLRSATLDSNRVTTTLSFLPSGARWLLLRIKTNPKLPSLPVAEVEVFGEDGPPTSDYEFKDSPTDSLALIEKLRGSLNVEVSAAEISLFEDAADGKLDTWTLMDAALLASGVTEQSARQAYKAKVDTWFVAAKPSVTSSRSVMQQGQSLLTWLHQNAMPQGYQTEQTDVSVIVDQGTYNCVSSAVLYAVLGTRFGLDVRGIEVPDHAFAIVYDGTEHADVETTTDAGFNPSRNRNAAQAFTARTGFAYIPDNRSSQRRETNVLGLIALIYYNHGVTLGRTGKHYEALLAYFRALSLDPNAKSAVKNALASLANWTALLSTAGEYERALEVLSVGLSLAPEDRSLLHNRRVVWQQRIAQVQETGELSDILAMVEAAHLADPKGGFDRQQANLFIRQGETLAADNKWPEALAIATQGRSQVNEASARELDRYAANVALRWFGQATNAKQWAQALDALNQGTKLAPKDYRLSQNVAYLLQEWTEAEATRAGPEAAMAAADKVLNSFPEHRQAQRAAVNFVGRRVQTLTDAGDHAAALETIEQYATALQGDRDQDKLVLSVVDSQARAHMDTKNWRAASEAYVKGHTAFPDNRSLTQTYNRNMAFIAQEWLGELANQPDAMTNLARELLERFTDVRQMPKVVATQYQQQAQDKIATQEFAAAVQIAKQAQDILGSANEAKAVVRMAFDQWAQSYSSQNKWGDATQVYQQGLAQLPKDHHLRNNAIATWHSWAKQSMEDKRWQEAIDIYQQGLIVMPNTGQFKQNIRYCEQEMTR